MTVKCDQCGKAITRSGPREHNFCCVECRNRWNSQHVWCFGTDISAGMKQEIEEAKRLNKRSRQNCRPQKTDTQR